MDVISFLFVPETNKFKSIWLEFTKMVSGANLNWGEEVKYIGIERS